LPAQKRASETAGKGAGNGIGFSDEAYMAAGARIASSAEEVFATADMIVKVKEPQAQEIAALRENQVLFTYLHLAADQGKLRVFCAPAWSVSLMRLSQTPGAGCRCWLP
jgi:alanine dehydrogenase